MVLIGTTFFLLSIPFPFPFPSVHVPHLTALRNGALISDSTCRSQRTDKVTPNNIQNVDPSDLAPNSDILFSAQSSNLGRRARWCARKTGVLRLVQLCSFFFSWGATTTSGQDSSTFSSLSLRLYRLWPCGRCFIPWQVGGIGGCQVLSMASNWLSFGQWNELTSDRDRSCHRWWFEQHQLHAGAFR